MKNNPQILAYYLPQYHPIPENDEWWGKGFTEWTNVGKAKPLFPGHEQPKLPGELGYYDLRVPETREAQAALAKEYGIDGFCYWHYWFGNGKQLLERPMNDVVESKEPDFPFCVAWANESWRGFNHGLDERVELIKQTYPSEEDHICHFNSLLPAFKDSRYITKDNRLLFVIYKPRQLPEVDKFIKLWNTLAEDNDLHGFFFVGIAENDGDIDEFRALGFDAVETIRLFDYRNHESSFARILRKIKHKLLRWPIIVKYSFASTYFVSKEIDSRSDVFPSIIPNWDHTPRTGRGGVVLSGSNPSLFSRHLRKIKDVLDEKAPEDRITFVKSWNEWAEGNYLEPDRKFGHAYLEAIRDILK